MLITTYHSLGEAFPDLMEISMCTRADAGFFGWLRKMSCHQRKCILYAYLTLKSKIYLATIIKNYVHIAMTYANTYVIYLNYKDEL